MSDAAVDGDQPPQPSPHEILGLGDKATPADARIKLKAMLQTTLDEAVHPGPGASPEALQAYGEKSAKVQQIRAAYTAFTVAYREREPSAQAQAETTPTDGAPSSNSNVKPGPPAPTMAAGAGGFGGDLYDLLADLGRRRDAEAPFDAGGTTRFPADGPSLNIHWSRAGVPTVTVLPTSISLIREVPSPADIKYALSYRIEVTEATLEGTVDPAHLAMIKDADLLRSLSYMTDKPALLVEIAKNPWADAWTLRGIAMRAADHPPVLVAVLGNPNTPEFTRMAFRGDRRRAVREAAVAPRTAAAQTPASQTVRPARTGMGAR